ncbi:hypothetical protein L7F22_052189 [Adiantum nelumboides]|nr:hypothetical protein [Adiantum nelumboides]
MTEESTGSVNPWSGRLRDKKQDERGKKKMFEESSRDESFDEEHGLPHLRTPSNNGIKWACEGVIIGSNQGDELVSGSFEFVEEQCMVTKKQEERWVINSQLIVRVKRSACDIEESLPPPTKRLHSTPICQGDCEAQLDTTCKLSSKLLSKNVLEKWQHECKRVRTKLKEMVNSRDDKFELHMEDFNGEPLVRICCHECGVLYGKGSIEGNQAAYNCCSNFMRTHILESTKHEMKYMVDQSLKREDMPKVVNWPQKDDKKGIEAALEKLHSLMATNEGWYFEVVEATIHDFKDKRCVRVRCLVVSSNLIAIVANASHCAWSIGAGSRGWQGRAAMPACPPPLLLLASWAASCAPGLGRAPPFFRPFSLRPGDFSMPPSGWAGRRPRPPSLFVLGLRLCAKEDLGSSRPNVLAYIGRAGSPAPIHR